MKTQLPIWKNARSPPPPETVGRPYIRYCIIAFAILIVMMLLYCMHPARVAEHQARRKILEQQEINEQTNNEQNNVNTLIHKRPNFFYLFINLLKKQTEKHGSTTPEGDNQVTNDGSTEFSTNSPTDLRKHEENAISMNGIRTTEDVDSKPNAGPQVDEVDPEKALNFVLDKLLKPIFEFNKDAISMNSIRSTEGVNSKPNSGPQVDEVDPEKALNFVLDKLLKPIFEFNNQPSNDKIIKNLIVE